MKYLLDSDVIISHLHQKADINIDLSQKMNLSVITYGEVLYGIEKGGNPKKIMVFTDFIEDFQLQILPLTQMIIEQQVRLKIKFERLGQKLDDFDLFIAATALKHDLTLVTADKRHFSRIPHLKLA